MGKDWEKNDIRYSEEAHIYCSAQPTLFPHIVLNDYIINLFIFNSSIKRFLCAVVVVASFLLLSKKNIETLHGVEIILWMSLFLN